MCDLLGHYRDSVFCIDDPFIRYCSELRGERSDDGGAGDQVCEPARGTRLLRLLGHGRRCPHVARPPGT